MLIISASQRAMMSKELNARRARALADAIYPELCAKAKDVLKAYNPQEAQGLILDTVNKCRTRDICDEEQILNICYIRFIIDTDLFSNKAFLYILDNGLMHPYAKARHLILSFFAINAMRGRA
jgi:hypothetical protein